MSVYDELAKLADLRDRGALTNEEFEREKATLLAEVSSDASSEAEIDPRVELIEVLELTLQNFHLPASEPPTLANTHIGVPADNGHREGWYGRLIDSGALLWWTGTAWATDWVWVNIFQGVPADNGNREGWYTNPHGSGLRWWDDDHWSHTTIDGDAPGWYPDPAGDGLRWWQGTYWSADTQLIESD